MGMNLDVMTLVVQAASGSVYRFATEEADRHTPGPNAPLVKHR